MDADALFVDTNVLLAATDELRTHHAASLALVESGRSLVLSAQIVREYLAVATRPVSANGLGLPVGAALENLVELRRVARLVPEERAVLPTFLALIAEVPCHGKRVHDAFVAATAIAHRVSTICTWNVDDFAAFNARVRVVRPDAVR